MYEFKCNVCGRVVTQVMRVSQYETFERRCGHDVDIKTEIEQILGNLHEPCPGTLETVLSPPSLAFKGQGWTPKHHS